MPRSVKGQSGAACTESVRDSCCSEVCGAPGVLVTYEQLITSTAWRILKNHKKASTYYLKSHRLALLTGSSWSSAATCSHNVSWLTQSHSTLCQAQITVYGAVHSVLMRRRGIGGQGTRPWRPLNFERKAVSSNYQKTHPFGPLNIIKCQHLERISLLCITSIWIYLIHHWSLVETLETPQTLLASVKVTVTE